MKELVRLIEKAEVREEAVEFGLIKGDGALIGSTKISKEMYGRIRNFINKYKVGIISEDKINLYVCYRSMGNGSVFLHRYTEVKSKPK